MQKFQNKSAYRSEMARTVIESYFRTSKMAAGGHFVQNGRRRAFCPKLKKKNKISIDLKWPEMPSKVNFGHPIWPIDLKWLEMQSKVILNVNKNKIPY